MSDVTSFEKVRDLLIRYAEVDRIKADEKTLLKVQRFSLSIFSAGIHKDPHDFRPDTLETELEVIRKQAKELVEVLSHLNPWTTKVARREAERARLMAAGLPEDLVDQQMIWRDAPESEWVDQRAISSLMELEASLKAPIETLFQMGRGCVETSVASIGREEFPQEPAHGDARRHEIPQVRLGENVVASRQCSIEFPHSLGRSLPTSKERKPDLVARLVAYGAGWALHAISDKKPSYWKDSSKFTKFCEALFLEFSLNADTRRACEWALSELAKNGKI